VIELTIEEKRFLLALLEAVFVSSDLKDAEHRMPAALQAVGGINFRGPSRAIYQKVYDSLLQEQHD
jgi:hypothetical protein